MYSACGKYNIGIYHNYKYVVVVVVVVVVIVV